MKLAALVLLFVLAVSIRCVAGTTGVLHGYLRTEDGQAIANADVRVWSPSQTAETHTDKHGFFVFMSLAPDVYNITAESAGTSAAYAEGARIMSDQTMFLTLRINSHLRCGPTPNGIALSAYEGDPFSSLDVRRMAAYPPNSAPPIYLPAVRKVQRVFCL